MNASGRGKKTAPKVRVKLAAALPMPQRPPASVKPFPIVGRSASAGGLKSRRKTSASPQRLRTRAERLMGTTRHDVAQMPVDDVQRLVHELQVHQIELEMQNDELRRTQVELEQARDRYADLYDFAPSAYLTLNAQGEILEANLNAGELLGLERGRLIHQKFTRFIATEAQDTFYLLCQRVFSSDARQSAELDLVNKQAKRLVVHVEAVYDPTSHRRQCRFSFTDITERKRAEERIVQLNRVQAILGGVDRAIVRIPDRQKLLDEVCRVSVETGGFKLAWIGMAAPDGSVQPVAQAGATEYLDGIRVVTRDELEGRGAVGTAIRENRPVVIEDVGRDTRMSPWRERLRQFGLHYLAAFPIRIAGKVAGAFSIYAPRADFFDESELGLLTQVSDEISYALMAIAGLDARKQAEEALSRSERNLSVFFNQAPIGLLWLSASGTILRANLAQLNLLGYPAQDYVGKSFVEFCEEPSQGHELLERLATKETVRNFPMRRRCKDGTIRHVLVDANSFWSNNQFEYSSIFVRDITDRIELEREILRVSDWERRRIAQDLHDGLGQLLGGTAYLAGTLRQKLAAKSLPEARQSGRILEVINEAIAQTRSLARGLHPVEPEPNGLMVALQALAARTKKLFHVRCHFTCPRPVLIKDNAVATHLFRIAQEAITNAIKHGKPGRIEIGLTETPGRINLAIKDNGAGMPARQRKKSGMGLRIMRYRAGMIGGSLAIQKEPDGGTTIVCTVHVSGEGDTKHPEVTREKGIKKD
ncbi:MAG: PAS domain S-box protein [Verrucomicrobiales bacterium]|nr:PAS domain S-box protein [Verrucomicrobiales bacterium]